MFTTIYISQRCTQNNLAKKRDFIAFYGARGAKKGVKVGFLIEKIAKLLIFLVGNTTFCSFARLFLR